MTRFRATVSYDGTLFGGFQRQTNARSVQQEIERALTKISDGNAVTIAGAGRTDAGVHATGQVVSFKLEKWNHSIESLTKAININLPEDVAVRDVAVCADDFHARFCAVSRSYEYTMAVCAPRQPVLRLYAWQIEHDLDLGAMQEAAKHLQGLHDFAAFGSATGESGVTVRQVFRADWFAIEQKPKLLKFQIEANGFLFRMVRRIVATLVRVGQGKINPVDVREILQSKDHEQAKGAAPACGLCLTEVKY